MELRGAKFDGCASLGGSVAAGRIVGMAHVVWMRRSNVAVSELNPLLSASGVA
jgi:hypothetical protein